MRRSPCHECKTHLAGEDKNGPECMNCRKRLEFVGALESMTGPVPMEMTDMGARRIAPEIMAKAEADLARCMPAETPLRSGRWTPDQDELVRTVPPAEAAKLLEKSLGAIYVRRNQLKMKALKAIGAVSKKISLPDQDHHRHVCPNCGIALRLQVYVE